MKTKLQNDKDKIKEFTDFVRDANTSYKNLYSTLTAKIAALDSSISSNKSKYNRENLLGTDLVMKGRKDGYQY